MLIANINDSCILVDFLKKNYLENIFKPIFSKQKEIQCGCLENFLDVSTNLKYFFEESSKNLNKLQKQLCKKFLA